MSHFISLRFSSSDAIEAEMANYHKHKREVILLPFWNKEYALVQMTRYCRFFTVSSFWVLWCHSRQIIREYVLSQQLSLLKMLYCFRLGFLILSQNTRRQSFCQYAFFVALNHPVNQWIHNRFYDNHHRKGTYFKLFYRFGFLILSQRNREST